MSGCKSCSGRSCEPSTRPINKAQKLEKQETSGNPRYPHLFVGNQAMYSDDNVQMIVIVLDDQCDEQCDCFTLKAQRILKGANDSHRAGESFDVSQSVGENLWKLAALI